MSEVSEETIVKEEPKVEPKAAPEEANEMVHKKAFTEVSNDMHKFKSKAKEATARINELEAAAKSREEADLKSQSKWEELYNKEKKAREVLEADNKTQRERNQLNEKKSALKAELGNVKDVYLSHANLDAIEIQEDGTVSSESVLEVANAFKTEYPELIPSSGTGNITNQAAASGVVTSNAPKSLAEMTTDEKVAELAKYNNRAT